MAAGLEMLGALGVRRSGLTTGASFQPPFWRRGGSAPVTGGRAGGGATGWLRSAGLTSGCTGAYLGCSG